MPLVAPPFAPLVPSEFARRPTPLVLEPGFSASGDFSPGNILARLARSTTL